MGEQVKLIYFAPRPAGRSLADFRARWRQHGALGMSQPLWRHMTLYKQLDALEPSESGLGGAGLAATAEDEWGGVGQIWVRSEQALGELFEDPSRAAMPPDEVETFGRELGASIMQTREQVVFDRGPVELSFVALIHRPPGFPRERFSARWTESGAHFCALEEVSRHANRYIQNHALPGSEWADGVVEVGFGSAAAAAAFFAEPKLVEDMAPSEADFVDHSRMTSLLVRENLLYDEGSAPVGAAGAEG